MKPTLQFKLTQHLTLTPQLQESIRLLQLSTVELGQEIERMVQENPLLELEDVSGGETAEYRSLPLDDQPEPLSSELPGIQDDAEAKLLSGGIDAEAKSGLMDEPDWFNDEGSPRNSRDDDEEREFPQQAAEPPNLREHLFSQLSLSQIPERDRRIVGLLVDSLDDDGYLAQDLEELASLLPPELGIDIDDLYIALEYLQHLDPPGIGARNLRECLLMQLRILPAKGTEASFVF